MIQTQEPKFEVGDVVLLDYESSRENDAADWARVKNPIERDGKKYIEVEIKDIKEKSDKRNTRWYRVARKTDDLEEWWNATQQYMRRRNMQCEKHETEKIYHDEKESWFCPFCTPSHSVGDYAPVVYDEEGNPMKVRMIGAKCEGDISGEGHYGYIKQKPEAETPTIYFEGIEE